MKFIKNAIAGLLLTSFLYADPKLDTPEKIYEYLRNNVEYTQEHRSPDVMQTEEETIKKRKGDCKDFANAAKHKMDEAGYLSELVIFYNDKINEGHMVCLFYDRGKYGVLEASGMTKPDERFDNVFDIANCDEIMFAYEDRANKKGFTIDLTVEECFGHAVYHEKFPLIFKNMQLASFIYLKGN